jgi:hypothetical protein
MKLRENCNNLQITKITTHLQKLLKVQSENGLFSVVKWSNNLK